MNLNLLDKKELEKRYTFRCIHAHNGLRHPECYERKNGIIKKIGFADIETTSLNADSGICLSWCIKPLDGKVIKRSILLEELHDGEFDKGVIEDFIAESQNFDTLVWHYGTDRKFDVPFLRTRAVYHKLNFPEYKCLNVADTWPILRNKFKLNRNSLKNACELFGIPAKLHPLKWGWVSHELMTGNPARMQKALNYNMKHNIEDVESTEQLWLKISKYVRKIQTSI